MCSILVSLFSGAFFRDNYQTKEYSTQISDVNINGVRERIAALERQLHIEQNKRLEEEAKLGATLKQVSDVLMDHRLKIQQFQRGCRQPCYTPSPRTLLDLQKSVAELQARSETDLAAIRAELSTDLRDTSVDLKHVERLVSSALKIYDADKTDRADYALQSAGGRVVSIRCTKAFSNKPNPSWGWGYFSAPPSNAEEAIRPGMSPGECWAFQGSVGNLVLELSYPVVVTGFTIEHISRNLSPTGTIDSAPRHFSVWGLQHADDLNEQFLFGDYVYLDNNETIQFFPVVNQNNGVYKFVELKIISNHGHPDYTCLYRIRVHGDFTPS